MVECNCRGSTHSVFSRRCLTACWLTWTVFYKRKTRKTSVEVTYKMLTRNILFTFLLDGSKSSPRQSQACSETKSYHDDGDDDGDEYTACACQRWMFVTIFMPIFVVLSILGFIFVLLLMPCKYQLHHCISFFFKFYTYDSQVSRITEPHNRVEIVNLFHKTFFFVPYSTKEHDAWGECL